MISMKGSGGGGYGSRPHVEKSVRTGTGSRGTRPAGVAQIGNAWGNHATHEGRTDYTGERLHNDRNFQPVPFGNEVALNVKGGGPGKGRTVMPAGGQGTHGAVNPGNAPAKNRDILSDYGPDYRK
jgi:hypothetical protein